MRPAKNIKSSAQKAAEGTYRKDRDAARLENNLPKFDGQLEPPKHFDAPHCARFHECCRLMKEAGVLQPQDFDAIVLYVENQILAAEAWAEIRKNGMTIQVPITTRDKKVVGHKPVTNPAFKQYQDCQKILKPLMEQFAFTPRARMGIKVDPADRKPKEDSPVMKLLKTRTGTDG